MNLRDLKIIQNMFTNHNWKPKQKYIGKFQSIWKLKKILLNNSWIKKEIIGVIRKHFELNENKNGLSQLLETK